MDRITSALLKEFSGENQLENVPEETRFEHFAAYLATSRHVADTFDTADLATGSGGDTGIDAIAILINGSLVTDSELVVDLAKTNGYLDVTFVFVQAERSAAFDGATIGTFGFGVCDFFQDHPQLQRNDAIGGSRLDYECHLFVESTLHEGQSRMPTLLRDHGAGGSMTPTWSRGSRRLSMT